MPIKKHPETGSICLRGLQSDLIFTILGGVELSCVDVEEMPKCLMII